MRDPHSATFIQALGSFRSFLRQRVHIVVECRIGGMRHQRAGTKSLQPSFHDSKGRQTSSAIERPLDRPLISRNLQIRRVHERFVQAGINQAERDPG